MKKTLWWWAVPLYIYLTVIGLGRLGQSAAESSRAIATALAVPAVATQSDLATREAAEAERVDAALQERATLTALSGTPAGSADALARENEGDLGGGLGLTQEVWNRLHTAIGESEMGTVYADGYIVAFGDGIVRRIERRWSEESPLNWFPPHEAVYRGLIPLDVGVPGWRRTEDRVTTVELYRSRWLAQRFSATWWIGTTPGRFTVSLTEGSAGLTFTRLVLEIGEEAFQALPAR